MLITRTRECFVCGNRIKFSGVIKKQGAYMFDGVSATIAVVGNRVISDERLIIIEATVPCSNCKSTNKFLQSIGEKSNNINDLTYDG